MPQDQRPEGRAEPWAWAGRTLLENLWLAALVVGGGALVFAWDDEQAEAYLLLAIPLLVLHALLEMRFFHAALRRRGEAPLDSWSARRILGFGLRWLALLAAVMGWICWWALAGVSRLVPGAGIFAEALRVGAVVACGVLVVYVGARILRLDAIG